MLKKRKEVRGTNPHPRFVLLDSINPSINPLFTFAVQRYSHGQAVAENRIRSKRSFHEVTITRFPCTDRRVCFTDYYYSLSLNYCRWSRSVDFSFFFLSLFSKHRDFKAKQLERCCRGEGKFLVKRRFSYFQRKKKNKTATRTIYNFDLRLISCFDWLRNKENWENYQLINKRIIIN